MLRAVVNQAPGYVYLGDYTWATKPAASASNSGAVIRVTDVGIAPGSRWVSDGTAWRPDGVITLGRQAAPAIAAPADTNENTLATVTIPAYSMGTGGRIMVRIVCTQASSGNAKTWRIRFGGTIVGTIAPTTQGSTVLESVVANRGAANVQQVNAFSNGSTSANVVLVSVATPTVDTSADVSLTITMQKADGADAASLQDYIVELLP